MGQAHHAVLQWKWIVYIIYIYTSESIMIEQNKIYLNFSKLKLQPHKTLSNLCPYVYAVSLYQCWHSVYPSLFTQQPNTAHYTTYPLPITPTFFYMGHSHSSMRNLPKPRIFSYQFLSNCRVLPFLFLQVLIQPRPPPFQPAIIILCNSVLH